MQKSIKEYQVAYNALIEDLKKNDNVLGVTVFGSIITGDIWKNSDIDMFIILDEKDEKMKDIFGIKCGIEVHMKILSKEQFLNFRENFNGGSRIHRKLISSKLVIGKDNEVIDKYNYCKFLNDLDKDRWNLVYLGDLIKSMGLCEKAIKNSKNYNAMYNAMKLGESFSKIYININEYLVSSDTLSMAINLDDNFKICMDRLLENSKKESIEALIEYAQEFLNENILRAANLLIEVLKRENKKLSIAEIEDMAEFKSLSIDMDKILKELASRGYIKKSSRKCTSSSGQSLIEELTYYCD